MIQIIVSIHYFIFHNIFFSMFITPSSYNTHVKLIIQTVVTINNTKKINLDNDKFMWRKPFSDTYTLTIVEISAVKWNMSDCMNTDFVLSLLAGLIEWSVYDGFCLVECVSVRNLLMWFFFFLWSLIALQWCVDDDLLIYAKLAIEQITFTSCRQTLLLSNAKTIFNDPKWY